MQPQDVDIFSVMLFNIATNVRNRALSPSSDLTDCLATRPMPQDSDTINMRTKASQYCKLGIACDMSTLHTIMFLVFTVPRAPLAILVHRHSSPRSSSCCQRHKHQANATRACHLTICQATHVELDILLPALTWVRTLLDMH